MKIGENIKKFREFRGITQMSIAVSLGKTKNVISNWERGVNLPSPDDIEKLCEILDVTPNQMFGWETNPECEEWAVHREEYAQIEKMKQRLNAYSAMMKDLTEKIQHEQQALDAINQRIK